MQVCLCTLWVGYVWLRRAFFGGGYLRVIHTHPSSEAKHSEKPAIEPGLGGTSVWVLVYTSISLSFVSRNSDNCLDCWSVTTFTLYAACYLLNNLPLCLPGFTNCVQFKSLNRLAILVFRLNTTFYQLNVCKIMHAMCPEWKYLCSFSLNSEDMIQFIPILEI